MIEIQADDNDSEVYGDYGVKRNAITLEDHRIYRGV